MSSKKLTRPDQDQQKQQQRIRGWDKKRGELPVNVPNDVVDSLLQKVANSDIPTRTSLCNLLHADSGRAQFVWLSKKAAVTRTGGDGKASKVDCDAALALLGYSADYHAQVRAGIVTLLNACSVSDAEAAVSEFVPWYLKKLEYVVDATEMEASSALFTALMPFLDVRIAVDKLISGGHVVTLLELFARILSKHVTLQESLQPSQAAITDGLVTQCDLIIKALVLMCSRMASAVRLVVLRLLSEKNDNTMATVLMHSLLHISMLKWCSKSCLSSSGMAIAQLMLMCGSSEEVSAFLRFLFPAEQSEEHKLPKQPNNEIFLKLHSQQGRLSLLSILRGVCLSSSSQSQAAGISDPLLEPQSINRNGSMAKGTLLFDIVKRMMIFCNHL